MSQSEILDAVRFAADSLILDGVDAWERALAAVEDLGAWDFDHYRPAKPGPCMLSLASYNEILKQHYKLGSATALAKLLDSREAPGKRLGFSASHPFLRRRRSDDGSYVVDVLDALAYSYRSSQPEHLYLNPIRFTELRKRLRKAKVPRVKWRIGWAKAVGVTS